MLILGSGGLRHIKRDLKIMALVAPWVICMSLIWTTLASSPATSGLDAYDLVSRLSAARINLDARSAQLILDLEIVRVQAWNAYLQQGRCEPRQSHLRGSQYPKQPRPFTGFVPMPLVLGSLVCILACGWAVHLARGFRTHFRSGRQSLDIPLAEKHPCGSSPCSYGAMLSETQKETAQLESNHEELQTEADDEMPNSSQAVERGIIDGMMLDSLNDFQLIKEPQRFMTQWSWTEQCGQAFLGIVHEGEVLASGFGGKVRHAQWDGRMVVTKEFYQEGELLKELFLGLLVGPCPYLGFGTNAAGEARLVSAYLPYTSRDMLVPGVDLVGRLRLAQGMLRATLCLSQLGFVHCDLKPDNFLASQDGSIFIIDFGTVTRAGDVAPMTCQTYRPPKDFVSFAWDVYSLGKVFLEVFYCNRDPQVPVHVVHLIHEMTQDEPGHRPGIEECLDRLL